MFNNSVSGTEDNFSKSIKTGIIKELHKKKIITDKQFYELMKTQHHQNT